MKMNVTEILNQIGWWGVGERQHQGFLEDTVVELRSQH